MTFTSQSEARSRMMRNDMITMVTVSGGKVAISVPDIVFISEESGDEVCKTHKIDRYLLIALRNGDAVRAYDDFTVTMERIFRLRGNLSDEIQLEPVAFSG